MKILFLLLLLSSPAWAKTYIIVNADRAKVSFDKDDIKKIYLGKKKKFDDGENLAPLDLSKGTPLRDSFYQRVTGKKPRQIDQYWLRRVFTGKGNPPKVLSTEDELVQEVANDRNAIAYVSKSVSNSKIRVLLTID